jgi:XTP/dITP diphosphohydrolase
MTKIFLATGNKKKIIEIKKILSELDIEIYSINDGIEIPEVIEDKETFEENSQKKAVEISKYLNMITIADDSGLCVECLEGRPGVYSARYSGENATDLTNSKKVIDEIKEIEKEKSKNRKAKLVTVITLAKPTGETYSFRGELEGEIIDVARGTEGFGYDSHFYVEEYEKTLSELGELKNKISHRTKALKKLEKELSKILG